MFEFKILKKSKSRARLGVISTPHGEIETPAFVPVATRGTIRTLDTREIEDVGSQLLICNTFHLHVAPGEKVVKKAGGIHGYMDWKRPLMTDSGGFQVYSLGFGRDHGIGKVLRDDQEKILKEGSQPNAVKITDDGVYFRSPIDGKQLYLSPKVSIGIQEELGADIMFAFDECPSPLANEKYMLESLEKTHRWAQECLDAKNRRNKSLRHRKVAGSALRIETRKSWRNGIRRLRLRRQFGYDKKTLKKVVGEVSDRSGEQAAARLGIGTPKTSSLQKAVATPSTALRQRTMPAAA